MAKSLRKTTIIIWSEIDDPSIEGSSNEHIVRQADDGSAYCSTKKHEIIRNPQKDPDWDGTDFFNTED